MARSLRIERDVLLGFLKESALNRLIRELRSKAARYRRARVRRWSSRLSSGTFPTAPFEDDQLWREALEECRLMRATYSDEGRRLKSEYGVGGGGEIELLYFLTRLLKPNIVVETGVAAGWSSHAILAGLTRNDKGHLYSSDRAYTRRSDFDYRQVVGCFVPDHLRCRWTLLEGDDRLNLERIAKLVEKVDLFHYDSDKSHNGRTFGSNWFEAHRSDRGVAVFDDINDNWHFRKWTTRHKYDCLVVGPANKAGVAWRSN